MSLNLTAAYLEARLSTTVLQFSKSLLTSTTNLNGPGGGSGDGFPLPFDGRILNMVIYDGSVTQRSLGSVAIESGDRVSLAASYNSSSNTFTISLMVNGALTLMQVSDVQANATVYAALSYQIQED